MGSNGAEHVSAFENKEPKDTETMVEIKIMTLDSQTYTLRVDKRVPVPALKEQIANVTGILSEQQRLLCRGKVLKDDQLLSAYHVEDGHTLHLVVRQPIAPLEENASDNPVSGHDEETEVDQSVLVASFSLSDQGDRLPGFGRILSAGLGSIGITISTGSGSEEITFDESAAERAYTISGSHQTDQPGMRDQPSSNTSTASYPSDPHSDHLQPQVIPDSLETLTQYLWHMRQECDTIDRGQNSTSQTAESCGVGAQDFDAAGTLQAGLPTPASMAEVLMSTRQLLNEQIQELLLQVARFMENQANVTDPTERSNIQAYAFRSGRIVQNLGALLLELGRPMMTLQMGPTPADAVVNAGPALFVSMTGPNPLMVQPQPCLPGTSSGAVPSETSQQSSGFVGGSVDTAFVPRNIDIGIRSGRVRVSSGDSNVSRSSQVSDQHAHLVGNDRSSMHNHAAQHPNIGLPDLDSSNVSVGGMPSGQGFSNQVPDGLNQLGELLMEKMHILVQHGFHQARNKGVLPDNSRTLFCHPVQSARRKSELGNPVSASSMLLTGFIVEEAITIC